MFGISLPSKTQTSWPSGLRTLFGAWSRHFVRHVVVEHVRRLDDVVVDAHQDHVFDAHLPLPHLSL